MGPQQRLAWDGQWSAKPAVWTERAHLGSLESSVTKHSEDEFRSPEKILDLIIILKIF